MSSVACLKTEKFKDYDFQFHLSTDQSITATATKTISSIQWKPSLNEQSKRSDLQKVLQNYAITTYNPSHYTPLVLTDVKAVAKSKKAMNQGSQQVATNDYDQKVSDEQTINAIEKYAQIKSISDDFLNIIHDLYGFYLDVCHGIECFNQKVHQEIKVATRSEQILFLLTQRTYFADDGTTPIHMVSPFELDYRNQDTGAILNNAKELDISPETRKTYISDRILAQGSNYARIRSHVLIMIVEYWEQDIRQRLVEPLGKTSKREVACQVMAELNHIRQDIVHYRGKLSNDSAHNQLIQLTDRDFVSVNYVRYINLSKETFNKSIVEIIKYLNSLFVTKKPYTEDLTALCLKYDPQTMHRNPPSFLCPSGEEQKIEQEHQELVSSIRNRYQTDLKKAEEIKKLKLGSVKK